MIRHPKRRGEWVEPQFMARAAAHGLTVSKPWGDSARYDFIVESRGAFYRVQVKSTTWKSGKAYICNTGSRAPRGPAAFYTPEQIDFFALYVIPEDLWYIIPAGQLCNTRYAAYLNPYDPKNRYFRFMEAWHLLQRRSVSKRAPPRNSARVDIQACAVSAAEPAPSTENNRLRAHSPGCIVRQL